MSDHTHERATAHDLGAHSPDGAVLVEILNTLMAIHDHQHEIAAALTMQKERLSSEQRADIRAYVQHKTRPDGDPAPGAAPAEASPKSTRAVPPPPRKSR